VHCGLADDEAAGKERVRGQLWREEGAAAAVAAAAAAVAAAAVVVTKPPSDLPSLRQQVAMATGYSGTTGQVRGIT